MMPKKSRKLIIKSEFHQEIKSKLEFNVAPISVSRKVIKSGLKNGIIFKSIKVMKMCIRDRLYYG